MIDGMMIYHAEDRFDTHMILSSPLAQAKAAELGIDLAQTAGSVSLEAYMWHMSLAEHETGEHPGDATATSGVVEFYGDGAKLGAVKGPPKVLARCASVTWGLARCSAFKDVAVAPSKPFLCLIRLRYRRCHGKGGARSP